MTSYEKWQWALTTSAKHPNYISEIGINALVQLWMAAALTGRLERVGDMAFSWMRWPDIPDYPPKEDQWRSEKGVLWVVDVVAHPDMTGLEVGKLLRRTLVDRGIATDGEKVYFFRHRTHRFGSLIARGN